MNHWAIFIQSASRTGEKQSRTLYAFSRLGLNLYITFRLALLREALLPLITLLPHPGNAVSHFIAITPHPKEWQVLKFISIAGAWLLVPDRLDMNNNFSALG
jgi:hypothetical protein